MLNVVTIQTFDTTILESEHARLKNSAIMQTEIPDKEIDKAAAKPAITLSARAVKLTGRPSIRCRCYRGLPLVTTTEVCPYQK